MVGMTSRAHFLSDFDALRNLTSLGYGAGAPIEKIEISLTRPWCQNSQVGERFSHRIGGAGPSPLIHVNTIYPREILSILDRATPIF